MEQEIKLMQGDCLELLKDIPDGSVDIVLTDPPYMINTKSTGAGKLNPWGDYCNAAFWYAEWMRQARRIGKWYDWRLLRQHRPQVYRNGVRPRIF